MRILQHSNKYCFLLVLLERFSAPPYRFYTSPVYLADLTYWNVHLIQRCTHFKYVHALAGYCVLACRCGSCFWLCNEEPRFLKQQHIKWNVVCHDFQATSFKLLFITLLQTRSNHLIVCSWINCTFIVVSGCLVGDLHRITE